MATPPASDSSQDSDSNGPNGSAPNDRATLRGVMQRLTSKLSQDELVAQTTADLRQTLRVDRVALYHFYRQWKGQVTFEALSDESLSIIGMTGADDCFNQDYAEMYLDGRIRAIPDIAQEEIHDCHREFLQSIRVQANLVVPILPKHGQLWGLLAAHHCQNPRSWSDADIATMKAGAERLATAPSLQA